METFEGDLDMPASVDKAMQGVSRVVLVTPPVVPRELHVTGSAPRAGVEHVVKTYLPTGPEALSGTEVAAVLTKVLGRTITFHGISFEEQKQAMIDVGLPEAVADDNARAVA